MRGWVWLLNLRIACELDLIDGWWLWNCFFLVAIDDFGWLVMLDLPDLGDWRLGGLVLWLLWYTLWGFRVCCLGCWFCELCFGCVSLVWVGGAEGFSGFNGVFDCAGFGVV